MAKVVVNPDELESAARTMREIAVEYEALARRMRNEDLAGLPPTMTPAVADTVRRSASWLARMADEQREDADALVRSAEAAIERQHAADVRNVSLPPDGAGPGADAAAASGPDADGAASASGDDDDKGRGGFPAEGSLQEKLAYASQRATEVGLTITSTTGGQHAPGSYHYQGRAIDIAGPASIMAAYYTEFAPYGPTELFYDPLGGIKHGQQIGAIGGHSDHVHIAF